MKTRTIDFDLGIQDKTFRGVFLALLAHADTIAVSQEFGITETQARDVGKKAGIFVAYSFPPPATPHRFQKIIQLAQQRKQANKICAEIGGISPATVEFAIEITQSHSVAQPPIIPKKRSPPRLGDEKINSRQKTGAEIAMAQLLHMAPHDRHQTWELATDIIKSRGHVKVQRRRSSSLPPTRPPDHPLAVRLPELLS